MTVLDFEIITFRPGDRVVWNRTKARWAALHSPRGTVLGFTKVGLIRVQLDGGRIVALPQRRLKLSPRGDNSGARS
jgi:hypothetical protein